MPIHDSHQVHEPPAHGDIGYICCPGLIGAVNDQISEQIGIDFVLRMRTRGPGFGVDRLQPYDPHQPLNPFSVYFVAQPPEMISHGAAPPSGSLQKLFIDEPHQIQILLLHWLRLKIEGGSADAQKTALV